VAGAVTRDAAQAAAERVRARARRGLGGAEPVVFATPAGRRGPPRWVAQFAAADRRAAAVLCAAIKGSGLPCQVVRN
jgi:hypothetical protein